MRRRVLSVLLALTMVLSLLPTWTFAAGAPAIQDQADAAVTAMAALYNGQIGKITYTDDGWDVDDTDVAATGSGGGPAKADVRETMATALAHYFISVGEVDGAAATATSVTLKPASGAAITLTNEANSLALGMYNNKSDNKRTNNNLLIAPLFVVKDNKLYIAAPVLAYELAANGSLTVSAGSMTVSTVPGTSRGTETPGWTPVTNKAAMVKVAAKDGNSAYAFINNAYDASRTAASFGVKTSGTSDDMFVSKRTFSWANGTGRTTNYSFTKSDSVPGGYGYTLGAYDVKSTDELWAEQAKFRDGGIVTFRLYQLGTAQKIYSDYTFYDVCATVTDELSNVTSPLVSATYNDVTRYFGQLANALDYVKDKSGAEIELMADATLTAADLPAVLATAKLVVPSGKTLTIYKAALDALLAETTSDFQLVIEDGGKLVLDTNGETASGDVVVFGGADASQATGYFKTSEVDTTFRIQNGAISYSFAKKTGGTAPTVTTKAGTQGVISNRYDATIGDETVVKQANITIGTGVNFIVDGDFYFTGSKTLSAAGERSITFKTADESQLFVDRNATFNTTALELGYVCTEGTEPSGDGNTYNTYSYTKANDVVAATVDSDNYTEGTYKVTAVTKKATEEGKTTINGTAVDTYNVTLAADGFKAYSKNVGGEATKHWVGVAVPKGTSTTYNGSYTLQTTLDAVTSSMGAQDKIGNDDYYDTFYFPVTKTDTTYYLLQKESTETYTLYVIDVTDVAADLVVTDSAFTISAKTGTNLLGKAASDLFTAPEGGAITTSADGKTITVKGETKYITNWTQFASGALGSGNYLPLNITAPIGVDLSKAKVCVTGGIANWGPGTAASFFDEADNSAEHVMRLDDLAKPEYYVIIDVDGDTATTADQIKYTIDVSGVTSNTRDAALYESESGEISEMTTPVDSVALTLGGAGASKELTVALTNANETITSVAWSSSNTAVATVGSGTTKTNTVTGVAAGSALLTATVTVSNAKASSGYPKTYTLTASVTVVGANDVSAKYEYASSALTKPYSASGYTVPAPTLVAEQSDDTVQSWKISIDGASELAQGNAAAKLTDAGTYNVVANGYASDGATKLAVVKATFVIEPLALTASDAAEPGEAEVTIAEIENQTYTGKPLAPALTITVNGEELTEYVDYTVSYVNNVNVKNMEWNGSTYQEITDEEWHAALTPTAIVTFLGNYVAKATTDPSDPDGLEDITKAFAITPAAVTAKVALANSSDAGSTYTGSTILPSVVVTSTTGATNGNVMVEGIDYTLTYSNSTPTNVGAYTVTVTAGSNGNYTFEALSAQPYFNITKRTLGDTNVTLTTSVIDYNGSAQTFVKGSSVSANQIGVVAGSQLYTLNNDSDIDTIVVRDSTGADVTDNVKAAGAYTVAVTGTGNWQGTVTRNFVINRLDRTMSVDKAVVGLKAPAASETVSTTVSISDNASGDSPVYLLNGAASVDNAYATVTQSSGTLTITSKSVGSFDLTISSAATAGYKAATAVTIKVNITEKAPQTVSITNGAGKTYGETDYTMTATTSGSGAITWTSSNTDVATIDASTGAVTIKAAGKTTIVATAAAAGDYAAGSDSYELVVAKKTITIPTLADKASETYDGNVHKIVLTGAESAVAAAQVGTDELTLTGSYLEGATNAGTYAVKLTGVSGTGSANYTLTGDLEATLTIAKATRTAPSRTVKDAADEAFSASSSDATGDFGNGSNLSTVDKFTLTPDKGKLVLTLTTTEDNDLDESAVGSLWITNSNPAAVTSKRTVSGKTVTYEFTANGNGVANIGYGYNETANYAASGTTTKNEALQIISIVEPISTSADATTVTANDTSMVTATVTKNTATTATIKVSGIVADPTQVTLNLKAWNGSDWAAKVVQLASNGSGGYQANTSSGTSTLFDSPATDVTGTSFKLNGVTYTFDFSDLQAAPTNFELGAASTEGSVSSSIAADDKLAAKATANTVSTDTAALAAALTSVISAEDAAAPTTPGDVLALIADTALAENDGVDTSFITNGNYDVKMEFTTKVEAKSYNIAPADENTLPSFTLNITPSYGMFAKESGGNGSVRLSSDVAVGNSTTPLSDPIPVTVALPGAFPKNNVYAAHKTDSGVITAYYKVFVDASGNGTFYSKEFSDYEFISYPEVNLLAIDANGNQTFKALSASDYTFSAASNTAAKDYFHGWDNANDGKTYTTSDTLAVNAVGQLVTLSKETKAPDGTVALAANVTTQYTITVTAPTSDSDTDSSITVSASDAGGASVSSGVVKAGGATQTINVPAGTTVTLTANPKALKSLSAWAISPEVLIVEKANASGKISYSFEMPASDITVTASFVDDETQTEDQTITPVVISGGGGGGALTPANVSATTSANGTIKVSDTAAKAGDKVTVTVTPKTGYETDAVTVKDKNGNALTVTKNADGTYSFTMPAASLLPVSVEATYKRAEAVSSTGFVDVVVGSFYEAAVKWAVEHGVTNGKGAADTFKPNDTCTRAEAVTFLYRAAGEPEVTVTTAFKDVVAGSYYEKAVAWAVANGITNGKNELDTFLPNDVCSRAEIVTFLARFEKATAGDASAFTDVNASEWYAGSVGWAVNNGITNGKDAADTFKPADSCTRAEIVTFLYRDFVK